jgi:indolepyruvate ferredoxin oxidoreductase
MTGGQDPQGQLAVPEVRAILLTQGVSRVLITADDTERYDGVGAAAGVEVWDRTRLIERSSCSRRIPGVTVLIHDQVCACECAPPAQAREDPDAAAARRDQPPHLRGLRRLRREEQLPLGAADRHAVRPQDR